MIVPICLFSGLANYSTQTLATFMLPITCFSVCKSYSRFSGPIYSISVYFQKAFLPVLRPPSIALRCSLNCCSHPKLTGSLLTAFILHRPSLCACWSISIAPFNVSGQALQLQLTTIGSNDSQYMNVAVPILKLFSIVTCYTTIIVHFVLLVTIFWQTCRNIFWSSG